MSCRNVRTTSKPDEGLRAAAGQHRPWATATNPRQRHRPEAAV